jgi:hypothetical protein
MDTNQNQIIITDETIISFYRENTHIDIISMNHILIDILKNLSSDLTKTLTTTINSKILSVVSNIDKNITDIDKNISLLKSDILLKFYETKKDYIEDIKNIVHTNILDNNDKINISIEKNNELFISKLTKMLNEIIPKSQENSHLQIESCIKNFSSLIKQDTSKLIEITSKIDTTTKDNNLIKTFIDNIDTQLTKMFSTIQQPIFNSIQSSEERTNLGMDKIKESILLNSSVQETLRNEMKDFLNKYKNNSQFKGAVAEIDLQHMLLSIMPSDEIIKVSSDTATCDFKVNRKDPSKPSILFENKYYKNRSAPTEEVKKFERDIQLQKNHGIFISQESPITYKDNFQIDIINGLIHVYIPNANYDVEKLKIAVDIIDNLSLKLNAIEKVNDDEYSISKEDMDELTEEYRLFGMQKSMMLDTIKNVNKQLTDKLEEIQLPKMKKVLMKLGNIENDNDFKCNFCNNWSGKNKASLGAHIRNCKFNPKNKEEVNSHEKDKKEIQPLENIVLTIPEASTIEQTKKTKTKK